MRVAVRYSLPSTVPINAHHPTFSSGCNFTESSGKEDLDGIVAWCTHFRGNEWIVQNRHDAAMAWIAWGLRGHFAIFVPSASNPGVGTLIHVVGAPMAGHQLQFKRNDSIASNQQPHTKHVIGQIDSQYIANTTNDTPRNDSNPKGGPIELVASQVSPTKHQPEFYGSC